MNISPIHWCTSHGNHLRGTYDDFVSFFFLILSHSILDLLFVNSRWCRIVILVRLPYIASCRVLACMFVRSSCVKLYFCWPFSIALTCYLMNYVTRLVRLFVNIALFITFDRVTFQLSHVILHASLHFWRISKFYQRTGCISLSWTLVFINIVVWSYVHVAWSLPVESQHSYDHLPSIFIVWIIDNYK